MKKLYILLFVFCILVSDVFSQIEVKAGSFREVPGFVNMSRDKQTDDNDKPYAVLKVRTEDITDKQRRELRFQGDARTFFEVEHKVRVMKEMFTAAEEVFTVTDGATTRVAMLMSANFVNVTVTTDSESDIYVDNDKKGRGRWKGRLGEGNHTFEAVKASHRKTIENITLSLGNDENITIPAPEPIYGILDVSTNPIGANIIIDGKDYVTTPRVLASVTAITVSASSSSLRLTPDIQSTLA